ncbi:hypothetical protein [Lapillicoccus jejuensis]|uniref:Uncharacterized protein n=1 Tax=Lapillicoccus jejuensis TaxID=402171 RepID=A0A542DY80_9MICO|nr:hypothetical protein [Lapillicoccus jejuensis]TQJ07884.1 hypothetical protein FB458_0955 [Lapillicoccus jejuensis]
MTTPTPPPRRVRVTSPRRDARRRAERRPATLELAEQTGLGEVYLAALLRAQRRLAAAILLGIAVPLAGLPALFALVPATRAVHLGPVPLPWVVVGVLLYPVVVLAARIYVRQSERVEREFAELMGQR